ncbi:MFS transporter [Sphingomonas oleivorans]|uniref:MFS transporter n=1 Tax=Sphingomonas oleivorans TaxID=1735121 RepID=A0A2T5FW59_9SPHN|nr:MFS transporter [Sphingomonas oleivorans]PTQ10017.1 MFS transporter [Sphingomonas oleivorans]
MKTSEGGGRSDRRHDGLTKGRTLIFAIACGLAVANIYYAQPLLDAMARDFGIDPAAIGLVVTLTQIGYALGLIFIVPLGDLLDRRRLIAGQAVLSGIALLVVAGARTAGMLFAGMVAVGLLAVMIQLLVAFAATLAAPTERGRAVGMVTSGVVIGILAARFVSGVLADLGGWRAVYLSSAVLTLAMAGILLRILPRQAPAGASEGYFAILRSIPGLFLRDPLLLVRGVLALLIFATFSSFWTALVLPLSAPPYSLSHSEIGLFGLVGVAGALAAGGAGRLADRGLGQWTTGLSLALLLASWGLIMLLPLSIPALLLGVLLLDLAVQAVHVTNQSIIFALYPGARSRLVGGYMLFYSIGSAAGAIASTAAYAHAGWGGVSLLGASFSATALIIWALTQAMGSSAALRSGTAGSG